MLGVIVVKGAVGAQRNLGAVCGHEQRGIDKDIVITKRPLLFCVGTDLRDSVVKIQPSAGEDTVALRLRSDRAACYNDILRGVKRVALRTGDAEISVERQRAEIDINAVREHLSGRQIAAAGDRQVHPVGIDHRPLVAVDTGKHRHPVKVQNAVFGVEADLAVAENIIHIGVGHLNAAYPQLIGISVFGGERHAFIQLEGDAGNENICCRADRPSPTGKVFVARWRKGAFGQSIGLSLCQIYIVHRTAAIAWVKADLDPLIPAQRTGKT